MHCGLVLGTFLCQGSNIVVREVVSMNMPIRKYVFQVACLALAERIQGIEFMTLTYVV